MSSSLRISIAALALAGCADLERGPRPEVPDAAVAGDGGAGDGAGPGFAAVRPLVLAGCASCHARGQSAERTSFLVGADPDADHRSTRPFVDPANAAGSRLLSKAAGNGHGGGAIWRPGSPEHAALVAWIGGGARP
jgi:hypothetical protein